MAGHSRETKYQVAMLLASGMSHKDISQATSVPVRTLHRWTKDRRFKRVVARLSDAMIGVAVAQLVNAATKAVGKVVALIDDPQVAAATQLKAAEAVLNQLLKYREQVTLAERLDEMQEQMNGWKTHHTQAPAKGGEEPQEQHA